MDNILSIYLFFLILLVITSIGISIRAFINWQTPGARSLGFLMLAMSIWAGFYILEITLPSLPAKILARKLLYLGMSFSPPFWLWFSLRYTGFPIWWARKRRSLLLAIPGGIAFLLGCTNGYHHLIWKSLSISAGGSFAPLKIEYGPVFWVFTVIAYLLILAGFIVYLIAHFRSEHAMRNKTGVVLLGALLTLFSNILFLFVDMDQNLDPTPLSFALSAPLFAFGFFRFGVTKLFPLAASLVMENLQDAIIIANHNNEVTDLNSAAKQMLGISVLQEHLSIFSILPQAKAIQDIWDTPNSSIVFEHKWNDQNCFLEARVIPIGTNIHRPFGRVVIFHDATIEQNLLRAEKRRSQQLSLLEETGRLIANSFDQNEILQRAVDSITQNFGYAETAISLLTSDNKLEMTVISGTEDFGYRPGFLQDIGEGIIGHTASIQKTYMTGNVSEDEHYYSTSIQSGSAICTPIFKQEALYGVIYIESFDLDAFDELDIRTLETLASQISESLQRASLYVQTQKDLLTITTIQNISRLVARSLDIDTISRTLVENLKDTFGYSHTSIYFLQEDYLYLKAQVGYSEELAINKIHISQGVAGKCIRTREVQFIRDSASEQIFLKADHHILSEICVPLLKDDVVLGILNVESTELDRLTDSDLELLTSIAGPIAVAVDNARLHAELKKMATTDAVTGLANRHVFEQSLTAEVERAQRGGTPLSLIIFDIDYFKQYNDQWGHPAGDIRLKAVADIIKSILRKYDIAARYGGDEFAIILENCDQPDAANFASRLRQVALSGAPNSQSDQSSVPGYTLSIGIATFPQDATNASDLLITADHAAMLAKQQGKNRIKTANQNETS